MPAPGSPGAILAMNTNQTKSTKWGWIAGIITFLVSCWLFANWEDFKEGLAGGYAEHTKSKP